MTAYSIFQSLFVLCLLYKVTKYYITANNHIYNIPIGFSDLEYVGVDTKFVFLG